VSTAIASHNPREAWVPPAAKPRNEAVWQAWLRKGQVHDRRGTAVRSKLVRYIPIAALLVAAGLWSQMAPYEVVVRFIVAAGATVVMFQELNARQYGMAAVFGALALLYNPVVPVFSFSDGGQRALVVASVAPFAVSLAWRKLSKLNEETQ
jgi:hypothetical protein